MRTSRTAMLVMFALAPMWASSQTIPEGTAQEKVLRLELAKKRIDAIESLNSAIREIGWSARALERERAALQEISPRISARHTDVGEAESRMLACIEQRRRSADDVRAALSALTMAIEETHENLRLTDADRRRLKRQIASFETRREREQALDAKVSGLATSANACQALFEKLDGAMDLLRRETSNLQKSSKAVVRHHDEFRAHAITFSKKGQAAVDAGWFHMPAQLQLPEQLPEPVQKLSAVANALPAPPSGGSADAEVLRMSGVLDDLMLKFGDLTRAADANAYINLPSLARGARCGSNCFDVEGERAQQRKRLNEAHALFKQREADLAALDGPALALVVAATTGRPELHNAGKTLAPLAEAGAADITRAYRQTQEWGPALREEYDRSMKAAQDEHVAAFVAIHGHHPPMAAPLPVFAPSPGPPALSAISPIRGHAYEAIQNWNQETPSAPSDPADPHFGSYTYVLFRGDPKFLPANVRNRYRKLVILLQAETPSSQVSYHQRKNFNLFVIPGRPRTGPGADLDPIEYASDLGYQWKVRAQHSILMHPTMRTKLTGSHGPFLLTLPTRIASANSKTPALFVDLAGYPVEAVTDLVNKYMNGMLVKFPSEQKVWKPAISTWVALTMITLADNGSDLAFKLFPASSAKAAEP